MPELKVTLLTYTPDPQKIMAAAAKLCYARADIDTVMEGLTPEKTEGFIDMLSGLGHESPMEHMNFTFGIENVSRSLLAQITRHRHASFSVQSQRYVKEMDFEFITPPQIERGGKAAVSSDNEGYCLLLQQSCRQSEKSQHRKRHGGARGGKKGDRGRAVCTSQRLHNKNDCDHERPLSHELF